ncbi:FHA domain-containing protein [Micromonospora inyonensis]|uniref:Uncharacterized protein n=1 Tax=Micromonospora inyonensis TaxID=47866 RepID=A0A1C6RDW3_9ACTN|nr:FHA domain-containing protein [Micromonospora inyonensis]SCL15278.1 hypothetical protein GA0074694_1135 [Micromonospora inyonensis]
MKNLRLASLVKRASRSSAPAVLDPTKQSRAPRGTKVEVDWTGIQNPDFVALGLGATSMMSLLWSVAHGRQCVGVELRGDPSLGVHWNIREDFWHHLGLIDQLMLERYGEEGIPRKGDGQLFRLRETFHSPVTEPGDVYADECIAGVEEAHVSGLIHYTEFIDDRYVDGKPQRVLTVLNPSKPPAEHDPAKIGRDMVTVLDGPSTFQAGASEVLVMLRRYLEMIQDMDIARGVTPRVRLFLSHRVAVGDEGDGDGFLKWMRQEDGFVSLPDGRKRLIIEEVQELDYRGRYRRIRKPGSPLIDLGVPELFMIAQGFDSSDADRLGFRQEEVEVDHHDGRGPVVAQADYLAGFLELHVGARLRRRIASEFDREGNEYWVRQIAVGHEDDPEVGWILVQVPDFKTFDPILAGLVPPGTPKRSKEYLNAYQQLLREYYLEQVSLITELPVSDLERVQSPYGPKLFSLVEKCGADALVAANGVVAGDSFGNGHFMTSGGAVTGMVGHASRVHQYWERRDEGVSPQQAIRELADQIKVDTLGWLQVSSQEFSQAVPINFGEERIREIEKQTGRSSGERATTIDATRRHRHSLVPLDPSDWRRLAVRSGRLHTSDLPPILETHPAERPMMCGAADADMAAEGSAQMREPVGIGAGSAS